MSHHVFFTSVETFINKYSNLAHAVHLSICLYLHCVAINNVLLSTHSLKKSGSFVLCKSRNSSIIESGATLN